MDKTSTGFENAIKKKEKNVLRSIFYDSENSDSSDSDNSIIPNQGKKNNNLECPIVVFTSEITGCEFQLIEDVKKGISVYKIDTIYRENVPKGKENVRFMINNELPYVIKKKDTLFKKETIFKNTIYSKGSNGDIEWTITNEKKVMS